MEMVEHHSATVSLVSRFVELVVQNNKIYTLRGSKKSKITFFYETIKTYNQIHLRCLFLVFVEVNRTKK